MTQLIHLLVKRLKHSNEIIFNEKYYFDYSQIIFKFQLNSLLNQLKSVSCRENAQTGVHHPLYFKQANILALEDSDSPTCLTKIMRTHISFTATGKLFVVPPVGAVPFCIKYLNFN